MIHSYALNTHRKRGQIVQDWYFVFQPYDIQGGPQQTLSEMDSVVTDMFRLNTV
jgi:hypothetical protein